MSLIVKVFLIICQPVRCSPVPILDIQPKFYSKSAEFRKCVIGRGRELHEYGRMFTIECG